MRVAGVIAGDGRGHDDAAGAGGFQQGCGCLDHVDGAFDIDVEDEVNVFVCHVGDCGLGVDACVARQDVERVEGVDKFLAGVAVADV